MKNTTPKEGSLSAPIRHPVDWQNSSFYDQDDLLNELTRVFDICHGCRRCVNLCQAFPTLFDLIDESETMEVDGVNTADYHQVVHQCYLCDLCYMTKCPYVPPHEWNVDFPHLMLRAKAVESRQKKISIKDKILSSPQTMGKLSAIPLINTVANTINQNKLGRQLLDKTLAVHPDATLPEYHSQTRASRQFKQQRMVIENPADKVAIFATCYGEYNEPQQVLDLADVLYYNDIEVVLADKTKCCGMPKLELGDIDKVVDFAKSNKKQLIALVEKGYQLIAPVPSCVLMFKHELPLLLPDDADIRAISKAFYDPFEYLLKLHQQNKLKTDFTPMPKTILYHVACHQRVQNIGAKTKQLFDLIPELEVKMIERCSGHDGTYGVRKETYHHAIKIARPIARHIDDTVDWVVSDCALAGKHIAHVSDSNAPVKHPISLVKQAYQL